MKINLKNFKNKKTIIIGGIVLFSLMVPKPALALNIVEKVFGNAAVDLLYFLINFIHGIISFFVRAGADFFEGMLSIGFKSHLDVVKVGWEVTRDFSNMFFILFMVIIAFATILRTEQFQQYGIKNLLPKVILIALLINFSYVIAAVVIDFSNIAANFFITDIQGHGGQGGLSGAFSDSLNLTKTYFTVDCDKERDDKIEECGGLEEGSAGCLARVAVWYQECKRREGRPEFSDWEMVLSLLISATVGSLVLLIAAFTFFAGGILLLIRIVVLWFLVMIVPFAFICYIMPALRRNWQKWWSTFLSWCFFAPAYAFFVWLAFKIAVENRNKQLAAGIEATFSGYVDAGPGSNPFTSDPGQQLISYFFIIALLIGGLIAAKQMGIYGAGAAMKIGRGAYRGAAKWTGARVRERAARPMEAVSAGLAKTIGRVPGFKWLAKAPAAVMKAQRADIEKEKKKWAGSSIDTLKSLYPAANRTQQIAFAQLMAEKGKLAEGGAFKDKDVENIIKLTNRYGKDLADNLLTNRPDLAPAVGRTKDEIVQKISPAKADKIQTESFKDSETTKLMLTYFRGKHLEKIADASIENANLLQEAIHNLGPDARARETALNAMNPKLNIYINSAPAKGMGIYSFD